MISKEAAVLFWGSHKYSVQTTTVCQGRLREDKIVKVLEEFSVVETT